MPNVYLSLPAIRTAYTTALRCLHCCATIAKAIDAGDPTMPVVDGWPTSQRKAIARRDAIEADIGPMTKLFRAATETAGLDAALRESGDGEMFDSHITRITRLAHLMLELSVDERALLDAPLNWQTLQGERDRFSRPHYKWLRDVIADDGAAYAEALTNEAETAETIYRERMKIEQGPVDQLHSEVREGKPFPASLPEHDIREPAKLSPNEKCQRLRMNVGYLKYTLKETLPAYLKLHQRGILDRDLGDSDLYGHYRRELRIATFTTRDVAVLALAMFPELKERLSAVGLSLSHCMAYSPDKIDRDGLLVDLDLIHKHADAELARLIVNPAMPASALQGATEQSQTALTPAQRKALGEYEAAIEKAGCPLTDNKAYALVHDEISDEPGELPSLETWKRYLRDARKAAGQRKRIMTPRSGRTGRSIAMADGTASTG